MNITGTIFNPMDQSGRIYKPEAYNKAIEDYRNKISSKIIGETIINHPDSILSLSNVSHIITGINTKFKIPRKKKKLLKKLGLYEQEKNSKGFKVSATLLDTPNGNMMKKLIEEGLYHQNNITFSHRYDEVIDINLIPPNL